MVQITIEISDLCVGCVVRVGWHTARLRQATGSTICVNQGNLFIPVLVFVLSQSCPTLNDPMDFSPQGSSVHGIFQARILE